MVEIYQADLIEDRGHIRELFWEYLVWANAKLTSEYGIDLEIHTMHGDMMSSLDKFSPPDGRLLLAKCDQDTVGCICMKRLVENVGEIKRMYVRPEFRGEGIGKTLVARVLTEAHIIGYPKLRLDSTKFMHAAHHLYKSFGFFEIEPYKESEIPEEFHQYWVFMELPLHRSKYA
jgi:GNAT superfamily N-acetyltransferase